MTPPEQPPKPRWPALALAAALCLTSLTSLTGLTGSASAGGAPVVASGRVAADDVLQPGPYHRLLDPLEGTWQATKTNYILGENGRPVVSRDIVVKTRWLDRTGGRYLQETTQGTLGGRPYHRLGVLGFSNIDRRYEWTTFDNVTPQAMTYRGGPVEGRPTVLSIPGEFTDPGILGHAGRSIPMRTVITIDPEGHHTFELYFTPPGEEERLVDKVAYTRRLH
ncbi:DUF1579 family protein [Streptomyces sp. NPDC015346]|uniref:DUF1579 family protein n=1 Tax=Streptomyces sp. NPDC015346 TaxID=3364954 RepID=UPI0036FF9A1C